MFTIKFHSFAEFTLALSFHNYYILIEIISKSKNFSSVKARKIGKMPNQFEIFDQFRTKELAIRFLREKGILRSEAPVCNIRDESSHRRCVLKLIEMKRGDLADGICWYCPKHKNKRITIRKGSFLEKQNIEPHIFCLLAFHWSHMTAVTEAAELAGVTNTTAVQWYQYFRDIASRHLIATWEPLGGPNVEVQIDESQFAKVKHNRGKPPPGAKRWVFGIWDTQKRVGFLRFVRKRNRETLLPLIEQNVLGGTKIVSDQWKAYFAIPAIPVVPPYEHLTVNHSREFKDPITGACTNAVEGMWACAKMKFKRMRGTQQQMLDSHLDEFMWRQRFGKKKRQAFNNLLQQIALYYPTNN